MLAACVLMLALACSGVERKQASAATVRDSAGVRIVESRAPVWKANAGWRIAEKPELSIGTVDGAREYQFTNIRAVIELSDGRIVVADGGSMQLRCFAPDGTFLWAIGRPGEGPGEFSTFTSVSAYRGDSIFVHDFGLRRFTIVAPNGGFGRTGTLALPPGVTFSGAVTAVGTWPDGSIAAMKNPVRSGLEPPAVARRTQTLFRYDANGGAGAVIDSVSGREFFESKGGMGSILPLPFGRTGRFVLTPDGAIVADNSTFELRALSAAGKVTHLFRRSFAAESISPNVVPAERERGSWVRGDAISAKLSGLWRGDCRARRISLGRAICRRFGAAHRGRFCNGLRQLRAHRRMAWHGQGAPRVDSLASGCWAYTWRIHR